jgi:hypothetical protein
MGNPEMEVEFENDIELNGGFVEHGPIFRRFTY